MNRRFERAARARRRKAAIYTALIMTAFFYGLILVTTSSPSEYLPKFVQQYLPGTETVATPQTPVATSGAVRP